MFQRSKLSLAVMSSLALSSVWASAEVEVHDRVEEEVVVTGSQIKGADIAGALPVTVLTAEDIGITGAISGDELLRSIPQMGAVSFNSGRSLGGVNDARGDVGSINLRGLGTGNTLTLMNGRRLVLHPGTQTENFVPVTTVNSNILPVRGLQRVEVLRDGAAAIYGADAVAGVVNYILDADYDGSQLNVRYGGSESSSLSEMTVDGITGLSFNDDRTRVTLSGSYYDRTGMMASERDYAASSDLRPLAEGTAFEGDSQFFNNSSYSSWGEFDTDVLVEQSGGTDITSSSGLFHIQPLSNSGCRSDDLGNGNCIDNSLFSTSTTASGDRNLRVDRNQARSLSSDVQRFNFFAFMNHEFDNGNELFGEATYYQAKAKRIREQSAVLSSQRFWIPRTNYYNPFGSRYLSDGVTLNPNRIQDTRAFDEDGLDVKIRKYRPLDAGNREITVKNQSFRLLGGLRGNWHDWDWETATVYSEFNTLDTAHNRIRLSAFQEVLGWDTPDAYNPFSGGNPDDPTSVIDPSRSSDVALNAMRVDVTRESETSLAMLDFKISNPAVFSLPAGDVGMASGIELRRETYQDDRDKLLDGSNPFIDSVTGLKASDSNVLGSSYTPDSEGSRIVRSAYVEFIVPLAANHWWAESLDMQLAARYEHFSDVGDLLKPKLALSWYPVNWLQFRGAYSEGFRAPNIPQIVENGVSRVNTRTDVVRDERQATEEVRSGNKDLQPEEVKNYSFGLVLRPSFAEDLTFTMDWWRIKQEGIVGILGGQNQLLYDSLLRANGSYNPNVIREADEDIGDGETVPGEVINVLDNYRNLSPRLVEGVDVSVQYRLDSRYGDFTFKLNAARLLTFTQEPDAISAELLVAQESGVLGANGEAAVPTDLNISNAGDLRREEGRPDWRATGSVSWRNEGWGAGMFVSYVSDVVDTGITHNETEEFLPVDAFTQTSVYGQYKFDDGFGSTQVRLGVRNLTNESPPLSDNAFGYMSSLHSNRGRYFYMQVTKNF